MYFSCHIGVFSESLGSLAGGSLFQFLASQIINNADVLVVSETKLDESFPTAQFLLDEFWKPDRLNRCLNGGGILLYVKDDISSRLLTDHRLSDADYQSPLSHVNHIHFT